MESSVKLERWRPKAPLSGEERKLEEDAMVYLSMMSDLKLSEENSVIRDFPGSVIKRADVPLRAVIGSFFPQASTYRCTLSTGILTQAL